MRRTPLIDPTLHRRRLCNWHQTPETRIGDAEAAAALIDRAGIASLFPASSEVANLFHAYVGDPEAKTDSAWDSPSGRVYGWRWALGRQEAAFYSVLVRKRPTWVSWPMLPAILRLRGELRTPDELYDTGDLSANAYRIAQALEEHGGTLSTGAIRRAAGFPTGKEHRAAYLKAIEELEARLLLAKVFSPDVDDMSHALVSARYAEQVTAAEGMTWSEALRQFLLRHISSAVYIVPSVLARDLKLPGDEVRRGWSDLAAAGLVSDGDSFGPWMGG